MAASDNTFTEAMQKIIQQIAIAATLPDADVAFCAELQAMITQKLRSVATEGNAAIQAAANPQQSPFGPAAAGGPMMGLTPSAPNMDEIRRSMGATGAVQ